MVRAVPAVSSITTRLPRPGPITDVMDMIRDHSSNNDLLKSLERTNEIAVQSIDPINVPAAWLHTTAGMEKELKACYIDNELCAMLFFVAERLDPGTPKSVRRKWAQCDHPDFEYFPYVLYNYRGSRGLFKVVDPKGECYIPLFDKRGNEIPEDRKKFYIPMSMYANAKTLSRTVEQLRYYRDAQVDPKHLFQEIKDAIQYCIDLPEYDTSLIALYIMGTWVYEVFSAFPYLSIQAQFGSGKTSLLLVIKGMCCNGLLWVNSSASVMFRTIDCGHVTLLMDENEALKEKDNPRRGDDYADTKAVLNAGYCKGSTVPRSVERGGRGGRDFVPVYFNTYCPKVLASTEPLYPILDSRCLQIDLLRTMNSEYVDREPFSKEVLEKINGIHDRLMIWSLDNASAIMGLSLNEIRNKYRESIAGIQPRTFQIMKPLLAIFDYLGLDEREGQNLKTILEEQVDRGVITAKKSEKYLLIALSRLFDADLSSPIETWMIQQMLETMDADMNYFTAQKIGYMLRSLKAPPPTRTNGTARYFSGKTPNERHKWLTERAAIFNVDLENIQETLESLRDPYGPDS